MKIAGCDLHAGYQTAEFFVAHNGGNLVLQVIGGLRRGHMLLAVRLSIGQPKITPTSLVASSAGIISQFIGPTFMLIYRSTISQANSFMSVLERINTVGMSIQVLDSILRGTGRRASRV